MSLEKIIGKLKEEGIKIPKGVRKRDGRLEEFDIKKIINAIYGASESAGYSNKKIAEEVAIEVVKNLVKKGYKTPNIDTINKVVVETLREKEEEPYQVIANFFDLHRLRRRKVREKKIRILSSEGGGITIREKERKIIDPYLEVKSTSKETSDPWDRERIILSLMNEAGLDRQSAERIAKSVENQIILGRYDNITTDLIRAMCYNEMENRNLKKAAKKYLNLSIPASTIDTVLLSKNTENSNIGVNNPEAVNFTISGLISKRYGLEKVFSKDIANAHTTGAIHLHDLDMVWRVYCSSHSLEYLKKYGLHLDNLQTTSKPPKHTRTLTEHLKTFFATMQAYYAGALGVGHINIFYAPLVEEDLKEEGRKRIKSLKKEYENLKKIVEKEKKEGKNISSLEEIIKEKEKELEKYEENPISILDEKDIEKFLKQEMQCLIFSGSQMAFSRGGQTLFLDFNIHTGVPSYLKNTLAIGPGGKYMLEKKDKYGKSSIIYLEERKLEEKIDGHPLIELVDPNTGKVVMKEKIKKKFDGSKELVQEMFLGENEKIKTYGDYDKWAKKITQVALDIWKEGDPNGTPFAFPKCDFHVSEETFADPEQEELLKYACKAASKNGSVYFVFDRDSVTLSACCRLRTAVTDNYVLKHPESMRFCGFQNVTINLPQAAYRAVKKGKKNLEGLLEEIDYAIEFAVKAHLQKKKFIESLQQPGKSQWQTGKTSPDGTPYIDLNKATYIIGIIGLNEAYQTIFGKELHELNKEEFVNAIKIIAHMNKKTREFAEKYKLKFALEETPAESATRRLSKIDLRRYPEYAKKVVKGDIEEDKTYYTNSIHLRPDANVDLVTRIILQSKFHPAIESGAIIHAFVGEKIPDANSIYNLVKKTFYNTQCAQIVISPEFTVCKKCYTTHKGLLEKCPSCHNTDKETLKGITRIVGYYSFIDNWNLSKLKELEDRKEGNYNLESISYNTNRIPKLENKEGRLSIMIFGKNDCEVCGDTTKFIEEMVKNKYKEGIIIKKYFAEKEEGLTQAMLGDINLSRIPAVVILDKDSNVIYKGEIEYDMNGNIKSLPFDPKRVESIIERYIQK